MVTIKRYYVPEHVLCGFPPKRLTTALDLYPDGLVVGLPPEMQTLPPHPLQPIVFGSLKDAASAHRQFIEDVLTWQTEEVDVEKTPCPRCMMLVSDAVNGHMESCPTRIDIENRLSAMAQRLAAEVVGPSYLDRPADTFLPRMFTSEVIGEDGSSVVQIETDATSIVVEDTLPSEDAPTEVATESNDTVVDDSGNTWDALRINETMLNQAGNYIDADFSDE